LHLKQVSTSQGRTAFSLGIAIKAVMKFSKISFLIGLHVSAVIGLFAAIDLAVQGRTGPAITFAILSAVIRTLDVSHFIDLKNVRGILCPSPQSSIPSTSVSILCRPKR
jgi:hypothetical protein